MNINLYTKEDYAWKILLQDSEKCIVMLEDKTLHIADAKKGIFTIGEKDITEKVVGFTKQDYVTFSLGYDGERIKDYTIGDIDAN